MSVEKGFEIDCHFIQIQNLFLTKHSREFYHIPVSEQFYDIRVGVLFYEIYLSLPLD